METVEIPVGPLVFTARVAGPAGGRLVLLLHGFPQTSRCWRPQLEALAEAGYRAVAPDQRGYSPGARPQGVEHYRLDHLVADALALADELGGHQFDLVGHDFGGVVAWALAARYPGRLRTLTAVSVAHPAAFAAALADPEGDQARRSAYVDLFRQPGVAEQRLLADGGAGLRRLFSRDGLPEAAVEDDVRALSDPSALTAALNWYRAITGHALREVGPVSTPTLYVWSTEDVGMGREAAEATASYVRGPYRFEVLEGVSHWVLDQVPDQVSRLLLEHLGAH